MHISNYYQNCYRSDSDLQKTVDNGTKQLSFATKQIYRIGLFKYADISMKHCSFISTPKRPCFAMSMVSRQAHPLWVPSYLMLGTCRAVFDFPSNSRAHAAFLQSVSHI